MTDRPYTDEDLRAEAAKQYATSTEDPDFMGISERMDGSFIESTIADPDPKTGTEPVTGRTWDELDEDSYDSAQRAIDDLIGNAADVSDWAISLGADGLDPVADTVSLDSATLGGEFVRMHFAFHPDVPEADRTCFALSVREAISRSL